MKMSQYFKHVATDFRVTKKKVTMKFKEDKKKEVHSKQNFNEIRNQCLQTSQLFTDENFVPKQSLLSTKKENKRILWKRPHEIVANPKFIIDGATRFDIRQGNLGDCWLLAAISNLTLNPDLFKQVVPLDQSFTEDYAGIFHFWFWHFGEWVEVVIDDRLPTIDGTLLYMCSTDSNEFWSCLLEKAYAKFCGSYSALDCGVSSNAMLDLTGGLTEFFRIENTHQVLFDKMLKAHERGSLMTSSISENPSIREETLQNGLVRGHSYSITSVRNFRFKMTQPQEVPLIRLRNPWGNEAEWNGAWSDRSSEWELVSDNEKEEMGLKFERDGEFWICFTDFCENFSVLEMTHVNLQSLTDRKSANGHHFWEVQRMEGSWIKGVSAGGCNNNPKTFHHNPKFLIDLTEVDEGSTKCTAIVSLIQKTKRKKKNKNKPSPHPIGVSLYAVPQDFTEANINKRFFQTTPEVEGLNEYLPTNQISHRYEVPPGKYCLIPNTISPNQEGSFILRIFTEKENPVIETSGAVCLEENTTLTNEHPSNRFRLGFVLPSSANESVNIPSMTPDAIFDWKYLQNMMKDYYCKDFTVDGFNKTNCRYLISIVDHQKTGILDSNQFAELWAIISSWKDIFQNNDFDKSGFLDSYEFREALHNAGFMLNDYIMQNLITRYGMDYNIYFDDFLICAVKLSKIIGDFHAKDVEKVGTVNFTLESLLEHYP